MAGFGMVGSQGGAGLGGGGRNAVYSDGSTPQQNPRYKGFLDAAIAQGYTPEMAANMAAVQAQDAKQWDTADPAQRNRYQILERMNRENTAGGKAAIQAEYDAFGRLSPEQRASYTGGQGLLGSAGGAGMVDPNAGQSMGGMPAQGGYSAGGGNGYLSAMADEIGRRTQQGLGQAFNGIRSNSIGVGGLGGTRQGVAEAGATGQAMDSLQGNLANLFGGQYNADANRGLQRYGMDQSNETQRYGINTNDATQRYSIGNQYKLGMGGLANQRYGMNQQYALGQGGLDNQRYGMDQNFYTQQRGQDLTQMGMGADLYSKGMNGEWNPMQNASNLYSPYSGMSGTTNNNTGGGGWQGALGGAITGATMGRSLGWW